MIEMTGEFTWEEEQINRFPQGMRQDGLESNKYFRLIRNMNWLNPEVLTKDWGIRPITASVCGGDASYDTLAFYDALYNDGVNKLVAYQAGAANALLYQYNITWAALSTTQTFRNVRPWMGMFADKLHVCDGSSMRTLTSAGTITTAGGTTYGGKAGFARVYANRLVVAGDPDYPYTFFPSQVRDSDTFKGINSVDVTGVKGDKITGLGVCGPYLMVGGENFTRVYYLGLESPRDWDWDELSGVTGPVHFSSIVDVSAVHGNEARHFCFFWSREGPMMVAKTGDGLPRLYALWHNIRAMVQGEEYGGAPGLYMWDYDDVTAAYVPEYDEVRFAVKSRENFDTNGASARNDVVLCLSLSSAVRMALSEGVTPPHWRLRESPYNFLPASTLGTARVIPYTHAYSYYGQEKCCVACNGVLYEMDAIGQDFDEWGGTFYPVNLELRKDGYDGMEDGVAIRTKSARILYVRTTQVAEAVLYATLIPDTGMSENFQIILPPISIWSADPADGTWGDGGVWNGSGFTIQRGQFGCLGKCFSLELYDNGNILGGFKLAPWALHGTVEDRR